MAKLAVRLMLELQDDDGVTLDRIEVQNYTDDDAGGLSARYSVAVPTSPDPALELTQTISPRWWFFQNTGSKNLEISYDAETPITLEPDQISVVRGDQTPSVISIDGAGRLLVACFD
jgi:hypothetical protein